MAAQHRETAIRIYGVTRVIRTEQTSTVKRLEADHTRAVKAALEEMHTAHMDDIHVQDMAGIHAQEWKDTPGFEGSGEPARQGVIEHTEKMHQERRIRRFKAPAYTSQAALRRPFPKVRFDIEVTDPRVAEYHEHITP